jgi:hypothetical protein
MTGLENMDYVYKHHLKVIEENKQLCQLLRACVHFLGYASAVSSDERNIGAIEAMVDKIKTAIGESEG